jgi:hypothetical protein
MNLKCKIIFNINIPKIIIIHVAMQLNGDHIIKYELIKFLKKGIIVDF